MDSDKRHRSAQLNETKKRIINEFERLGMFYWVTKGKEIENYIPKQAVEAMFGVKVETVNIMNVRPKTKRVGKYVGKTNRRRKAIVKLAEGQEINLFGE